MDFDEGRRALGLPFIHSVTIDLHKGEMAVRLSDNESMGMEAQRDGVDAAKGADLAHDLEVLRVDADQLLELCSTVEAFLMVQRTVKSLDGDLLNLTASVKVTNLSLLHA